MENLERFAYSHHEEYGEFTLLYRRIFPRYSFYALFYKRNRKHFPRGPTWSYVIETLVEVRENSK